MKRTIFTLIVLMLLISSGLSQGVLIGVVTDSLTREPLAGANIYLEGTAVGASTDMDGAYRIEAVPYGSYTMVFSYLGYRTKKMAIIVDSEKRTKINAGLIYDVIEGEAVIVTAQAEGQMAAINQQINSNIIVNVISEEKIQELPDANAAEAIGRLPGVSIMRAGGEANKVLIRGMQAKFSPITIDGVRIATTDSTGRSVDLSTLSQSSLAGIELYKAITPDMDGDALAGSINLVTKKAPEFRKIKARIQGNYNELMKTGNQYDLSLRYGERFFNNILGVQLVGNLEKKIRSSERIDVSDRYQPAIPGVPSSVPHYVIENFNVEFTDEIRKRNGFSVLLDINTPDDGTIRINNVYGGTKRDYLTHFRDYPLTGDATTYDFRQREQNINTFNSSIRGENRLFGFGLNWGLSFAESKSDFPFDYQMIFNESNSMRGTVTFTDYKEIPEKLIPLARNNFAQTYQAWGYFRKQDNYERERTALLDISRDYNIARNISGVIKVGTKYKVRDRTNITGEDFSPYYLDGQWKADELESDGTIRPKNFSGSYFEDWYNAGGGFVPLNLFYSDAGQRHVYNTYILTPFVEKERLIQWQRLNQYGIDPTGNIKEIWVNPLYRVNDYDITENVSAFYIMNKLQIGQQLMFVCGLRTEHEYNDYNAYYMKSRTGGFPLPENILFDTTSFAQQMVYLPNFHLAYSPTDYLKFRLAAYKALARPDFNMRIDRYVAGRGAVLGSPMVVEVGNIGLKTAEAWNYEINTSVYNHNIGLISVSAFYKEIDNMYHMLNGYGTTGDSVLYRFGINWESQMRNTAYELTLPYNSDKPTKVWGFEFEHQINFYFLPGYLKGIVLSYNASIVRSETYVFGAKIDSAFVDPPGPIPPTWTYFNTLDERKTKLEGQPEFFGNIILGYDIGGFSGRISVFHQAEYNDALQATYRSYTINKAFTRIDLTLKQRITNYFSLFLNVNNLTNIEEGNFNYDSVNNIRRFNKSEKYGTTIDFGIIGEL
jgi:TonB-dependent receptor